MPPGRRDGRRRSDRYLGVTVDWSDGGGGATRDERQERTVGRKSLVAAGQGDDNRTTEALQAGNDSGLD